MTLQEKFGRIVDNLLTKTKAGKIEWEPSIDDDSFVTSREDSSVVLELVRTYQGQEYRIGLVDKKGRRVETIRQFELPNSDPLEQLYDLARVQALKVEGLADAWLG